MEACELGQARNRAAISSSLFVRWVSLAASRWLRVVLPELWEVRPRIIQTKTGRDKENLVANELAAHFFPSLPLSFSVMADLLPADSAIDVPTRADRRPGEYVVVARRYRPQAFNELIGQEHVAKGLAAAIEASRVGHAYLFTGARGTGKTSTARILAKALNCERGPTPTPCEECDACLAITAGSDMDVLEIDGASNNGIDQIRELRQNANVRPSRSRFKIYIIDEVHMLSTAAFNGLLKTLEEPPEHVKFIFCTTNAEKIPITILSRCQRYDFAGIQTQQIAQRLTEIVQAEGAEAEPEALAILARRAAGSMRDSQSLLEQLLAFGSQRITVADVHSLLGTAGSDRVLKLVRNLMERNAAAALVDLDEALAQGIDVGQLVDQLLGYFRDVMVTAVGCPPQALMHVSIGEQPGVAAAAQELGLETVLAVLQILDQTQGRLKYLTAPRMVVELALVRICQLESLDALPQLIAQLKEGLPLGALGQAANATPAAAKKKFDGNVAPPQNPVMAAPPAANGHAPIAAPHASFAKVSPELADDNDLLDEPTSSGDLADDTSALLLSDAAALALWNQAAEQIGGLTASNAQQAVVAAIRAPNMLVVTFAKKYNASKSFCERPEIAGKLAAAAGTLARRSLRLAFQVLDDDPAATVEPVRGVSRQQRMYQVGQQPFVRQAMDLFDATAERLDEAERAS